MSPAPSVDHVVQAAVLFCGCDCDHSLMGCVPCKSVQFGALQKAYGYSQLTALLDDALQTQVVTLLRQPHPLESAASNLNSFAHRIKTVDVVHGMVSVLPR